MIAYGVGRFGFESLRGDAERRYLWDFSEAQWFSPTLMSLVVAAELSGALPFRWWQAAALAGLLASIVGVAPRRRERGGEQRLLQARHVVEIAAALDRVAARLPGDGERAPGVGPGEPSVAMERTSRGLVISAGETGEGASRVRQYALSSEGKPLSEATAKCLADLIVQLRHPSASRELVRGGSGVYHLLLRQSVA